MTNSIRIGGGGTDEITIGAVNGNDGAGGEGGASPGVNTQWQ